MATQMAFIYGFVEIPCPAQCGSAGSWPDFALALPSPSGGAFSGGQHARKHGTEHGSNHGIKFLQSSFPIIGSAGTDSLKLLPTFADILCSEISPSSYLDTSKWMLTEAERK